MANSPKASAKNDPPPNQRNKWAWGFTPQAEIWNSRLAMLGIISVLAIELMSGDGVIRFWTVLSHPELMP